MSRRGLVYNQAVSSTNYEIQDVYKKKKKKKNNKSKTKQKKSKKKKTKKKKKKKKIKKKKKKIYTSLVLYLPKKWLNP